MRPAQYKGGDDRYVDFGRDFIGLRFADTQRRILRACARHQRVMIVSGNGVGKSYAVAALILAFLYTNPDSTVMGTSGTYSQFIDTMWRPMKNMWKELQDKGLPGRKLEGSPEIRVEDDWYAKVVSPRDPGNVEGRHADDILVVIEEADKKNIDDRHFESAGTSITDSSDRMVAIANPPSDESNIVYEKMNSDRWHTIQFSSFESHNVKVDAGLVDAEIIDGLVGLCTLADDWEAWNERSWPRAPEQWDGDYPGAYAIKNKLEHGDIDREQAVSTFRPGFKVVRQDDHDLDERWFRRRMGEIPPDTAAVYRPFTVADVDAAVEATTDVEPYRGIGWDVARKGGDWNVICAYDGHTIEVVERWKGADHVAGYDVFREYARPHRDARLAIDAQGEGSGKADDAKQEFGSRVTRFNAGAKPAEEQKFYDKWAEGLYHLGQALDGGAVTGDKIDEELRIAAREVSFSEKYYASRDSEVLKATSKDVIKDRLGRSPDVLDAAMQAVWAVDAQMNTIKELTW
jgi:hypothetical protein